MRENQRNSSRKSPWRFVFLAIAVLGLWELVGGCLVMLFAGIYAAVPLEVSSVGVIGGADGPTAIFVTRSIQAWYEYALPVLMVVIGILGFLKLRNIKPKE